MLRIIIIILICLAPSQVHNPEVYFNRICEVPMLLPIERATTYQAVPWQTNNDPFHTASMFRLNKDYNHYQYRILAVSRDLLEYVEFGDTVIVHNAGMYSGKWVVHDLMNRRYTNTIDFLIDIDMPNGLWSNVMIEL